MPLAVFERKKVARVLLVLHVYVKTDVAKFSVIFIAYSVAKFHVLFIAYFVVKFHVLFIA